MTQQEFLDLAQGDNYLNWDWLCDIDYRLDTNVFADWYIRTRDDINDILYDRIRYWDGSWVDLRDYLNEIDSDGDWYEDGDEIRDIDDDDDYFMDVVNEIAEVAYDRGVFDMEEPAQLSSEQVVEIDIIIEDFDMSVLV